MDGLSVREVVIFLATAGLLIPLLQHLRVSPVLGFLLAGLALGPFALGRLAQDVPWLATVVLADSASVHVLAELGIVFLLFMIGLELSLARLWSMRRLVFGLGGAQIVACGVAIALVARSFGNSLEASAVLGACLALSSTAIVIQVLTEQRRFGTPLGRGTFAVLLAQDLAVIPILFLLGAFGASSASSVWLPLAIAMGQAVVTVALILGIGRLLIRPLFRFVGALDAPETFMAVTLLTIVATAGITNAAGMSAALGAFLAGLLLAETEFRHEIEVNIEPFKGLLLGLFFMSVGMGIDLSAALTQPAWLAAAVLGLVLVKATVVAVLARLAGFSSAVAVEMGLLLGPGGEFAFVVVSLAASLALLPQPTAQFMLIVVGATMLLNPLIGRLGAVLGAQLAGVAADSGLPEGPALDHDLADHVVIAGYGRTGQMLAELLDEQQYEHLALDLSATNVARLHAAGAPVFHGDASRAGMLTRVRLQHAAALVVTMNDADAAARVVQAARDLAPHVPIIARARDAGHADELLRHGAVHAVPEVFEASLNLAAVLLEDIGLPGDAARKAIEARRTAAGGNRGGRSDAVKRTG